EELESRLAPANNFFLVPGTGQVMIDFHWRFRDAAYKNEMVAFTVQDEQGRVNGILPGAAGYAAAALQNAMVGFHHNETAGKNRQLNFMGGDRLGFALIQNHTMAFLRANNPNNNADGPAQAFFSFSDANTDNFDHVHSQTLGDGRRELAWEDGTGGGDQDFND